MEFLLLGPELLSPYEEVVVVLVGGPTLKEDNKAESPLLELPPPPIPSPSRSRVVGLLNKEDGSIMLELSPSPSPALLISCLTITLLARSWLEEDGRDDDDKPSPRRKEDELDEVAPI